MTRHPEDRLNGIVEAALNHCMDDEAFLLVCAQDPGLDEDGVGFTMPETVTDCYLALEGYICDHLARVTE